MARRDAAPRPVHERRCAESIRLRRLLVAGDPDPAPVRLLHDIAAEIVTCCGHRPLKAYRMAFGWTVRVAVERVLAMCEAEGLGARGLNERSWLSWEAGANPSRDYENLLCRCFRTGPVQLGFATDYTPTDEGSHAVGNGLPADPCELPATPPSSVVLAGRRPVRWQGDASGADQHGGFGADHATVSASQASTQWYQRSDGSPALETHRREVLRTALAGAGLVLSSRVLAAVEVTRHEIDRTLSAGSISPAKMSLIEETVEQHSHAYTRTAPLPMLGATVLDFTEIRSFAADRQPAVIQARLSQAAARLAILAADALMKLGEIGESRAWYRTARLAADDTGNLPLRARVRAQEAMLPYYYGDPAETVRLAREAQALVHSVPCPAAALAAAAEARALARLGKRENSEAAMRRAQETFDRVSGCGGDDAFAFPEQRLLFYMSGALTHLGEFRRAEQTQQQALSLYRDAFVIDPTLLRLDQATCLAGTDDIDGACIVARTALSELGPEHRTRILLIRANDVVTAIPERRRSLPVVDELREAIALPAISA